MSNGSGQTQSHSIWCLLRPCPCVDVPRALIFFLVFINYLPDIISSTPVFFSITLPSIKALEDQRANKYFRMTFIYKLNGKRHDLCNNVTPWGRRSIPHRWLFPVYLHLPLTFLRWIILDQLALSTDEGQLNRWIDELYVETTELISQV